MSDSRIASRAATLGLILLSACFAACGTYSLSSGRVDETIRKVHVPFLENATAEPTVGIDLTESIIQAFQEDNTLKIVDESDASADLTGRVITYRLKEAFTSASGGSNLQVDEYQVQIQVELTFSIRESGEELFSKKRVRGTGNFTLEEDGTDEQTARDEAAAEIVRGVLAAVVEDW